MKHYSVWEVLRNSTSFSRFTRYLLPDLTYEIFRSQHNLRIYVFERPVRFAVSGIDNIVGIFISSIYLYASFVICKNLCKRVFDVLSDFMIQIYKYTRITQKCLYERSERVILRDMCLNRLFLYILRLTVILYNHHIWWCIFQQNSIYCVLSVFCSQSSIYTLTT